MIKRTIQRLEKQTTIIQWVFIILLFFYVLYSFIAIILLFNLFYTKTLPLEALQIETLVSPAIGFAVGSTPIGLCYRRQNALENQIRAYQEMLQNSESIHIRNKELSENEPKHLPESSNGAVIRGLPESSPA